MKIKITVSYEIDNFIDEIDLKECYNNSLEEAFKDINDCEHFHGLVNFDTEKILKIEKVKEKCKFLDNSGYCENNSYCNSKSHIPNTNDYDCMDAL